MALYLLSSWSATFILRDRQLAQDESQTQGTAMFLISRGAAPCGASI